MLKSLREFEYLTVFLKNRNFTSKIKRSKVTDYAALSIMVHGALSDDHLIQLKVATGTLNAQKYQDEILESGVRPPLDSLVGQNMVLRDDIARPHCTRTIEEYKNQQNITSLPRSRLLSDLNPIEHVWDKLS